MEEESYGIVPVVGSKGDYKVLLVKNINGNHWGFPKGKKEYNEDGIDVAKRELREETGLVVVKFLIDRPLKEKYTYVNGNISVNKIVYYYIASVDGVLELQSSEISDSLFLSFEDAYSRITFDESKKILKDGVKILKEKGYV